MASIVEKMRGDRLKWHVLTREVTESDRVSKISKGSICWRKSEKWNTIKEVGDVIENNMRWAGVSWRRGCEDVGDRVQWKWRTRMTNLK